jgi:hypothetical protein
MPAKTRRKTPRVVYLLQHVARENTEGEDVKVIGVYSSRKKGAAAINKAVKLPGFKQFPSGFYLDKFKLNEDGWAEGFVMRGGHSKPPANRRLEE